MPVPAEKQVSRRNWTDRTAFMYGTLMAFMFCGLLWSYQELTIALAIGIFVVCVGAGYGFAYILSTYIER
jgi:hypothetical protein